VTNGDLIAAMNAGRFAVDGGPAGSLPAGRSRDGMLPGQTRMAITAPGRLKD